MIFGAWLLTRRGVLDAIVARAGSLGALGERLRRPVQSVAQALKAYGERPRQVALALLLCLPIHLTHFAMVWVGARGLGIEVDFVTISAVLSVVWMLTMLPISVGGLGLRELGFVFLLAGTGVAESQAGALAMLVSSLVVLFAVAGVPLIWLGGPPRPGPSVPGDA